MPTNAEIAAKLLNAAAKFFRDVAGENPVVRDQMLTPTPIPTTPLPRWSARIRPAKPISKSSQV